MNTKICGFQLFKHLRQLRQNHDAKAIDMIGRGLRGREKTSIFCGKHSLFDMVACLRELAALSDLFNWYGNNDICEDSEKT